MAAAPMGRARAWKMAIRLPTLTAAVSPVLVGTGLAIHDDEFVPATALVALLIAISLQVAANFANDVFDFRRGADTADRLGPPRVTQLGILGSTEMLTAMCLFLGLALLGGVYLAVEAGWAIVVAGVASMLAAVIYTGGPWPIGYHALGDLFTFVFFGLVAVMGTYYVQAGALTGASLAAAIPIGCTVTMILVVNNLRDIATDRAAGKTTLGVVLGERGTRAWFIALLAVAWATAGIAALFLGLSWSWLAVPLSAPSAYLPVRAVVGGVRGRNLNLTLKSTARFNLVFGICWALSLAIS